MTADIVVVGDVMTDIIVRPHGPLVPGSDRAATIRPAPGGSGANLACWIAHLGGRVAFAGRAGADEHAAQSKALRHYGVNPWLAADDSLPTGRLIALLDQDGERSFLTDRGANDALCRSDLPDALLPGAKLLHVSGYSLFTEGPRAAVLDYMEAARRAGLLVSIDASSAGFIAACGPEQFLAWTGGHMLFANTDEAAVLSGSPDLATQIARLSPLYPLLVIKRGAAGAVGITADGTYAEVPAPAAGVVDTTGAGDAFLAAFLLARLAGEPLAGCLLAGVRQGSAAAERLGGRP